MKFDYKIEILSPIAGIFNDLNKEYEKILNEYGSEGYELVEILLINKQYFHVFKKQLK